MARSSTDVVRARGTLRDEMATGDLGDARLNARRNRVMTALEQSPDVGFPEACADGSETEALYRFLREAHPPPGETPVEWWLATTERIETVADVLQIVEWYRTRWLIEEFFKCLKTGCAYEKRQLESLDTLLVALALLAPIAWQLLLMRHLARAHPETRATVALTPRQIAILRTTPAGRALSVTPSMRDALLVVARLGGHLRQNGEPGWLVLTRGRQKLRDMETGWAAAERARTM